MSVYPYTNNGLTGNQIVYFRYNTPLDAEFLNKRLEKILPVGIYTGLDVTQFDSITIRVTSGVAEVKSKDLYYPLEINPNYFQLRFELENDLDIDTVNLVNTLGGTEFYIVIEYLYVQDTNFTAEIKGVTPGNLQPDFHLILGKVITDTSGNIVSIDLSERNFVGELLVKGIYDKNNNGIVDDSDKILGKDVMTGQDIDDNIIDPVNFPDDLVSLNNNGKFPDKVLPDLGSIKIISSNPIRQNPFAQLNNDISSFWDFTSLINDGTLLEESKGVILTGFLDPQPYNVETILYLNDDSNNIDIEENKFLWNIAVKNNSKESGSIFTNTVFALFNSSNKLFFKFVNAGTATIYLTGSFQ